MAEFEILTNCHSDLRRRPDCWPVRLHGGCPSAKITRFSADVALYHQSPSKRLPAEVFSPQPSRFLSLLRLFLDHAVHVDVKMSAGSLHGQLVIVIEGISTCFAPRPSMSNAARETKCFNFSTAWAGQISPPVQRRTASPSSRIASREPHRGRPWQRGNT